MIVLKRFHCQFKEENNWKRFWILCVNFNFYDYSKQWYLSRLVKILS